MTLRLIVWKRKIKMLGVCLLLLVIMAAMSVYAYIDADEVIHFSRESGFYEESFYLEIEEKMGCTFYYTLDGSKPDMTSKKYVSPILIEDVSGKSNVYSARRDISPGLYDERGTVEITPDYPVDKCNVVRVAAYDERQRLLAEATEVYFIGFHGKSGYDGIMKVSLVTDPDNLFDFESGIYVLGKKYDEYPQKGDTTILMTTANYWEKGKDWEKAALLDLFDQNGEKLFSSDCGIRIHGGMTRNNPQKSFSIYARDEYGEGGERFTYDLFENGVGVHKFILSSGGNDDTVKVKDYITQKAAADAELNVATMKMIPCTLFLNGEYWGVYYMTESYNASYISDHYGVAEGNIVMVKTRGDDVVEMKEGNEEDIELYNEMTEYISSHDMREKDAYQKACEMLDIDSFVDYYAVEIYIGNHDWPGNNEALWRAREKYPLNIWADGRWRYMLFDTNLYSVFGDASLDDLERAIDSDPVFASLIQNAEVEQKFKERIRLLENEIFCFENREEVFNRWFDEMSEPVKKSDERFYDITYLEDISSSLASMKLFLEERPEYMEQYMRNCFGDEN